MKLYIGRLPFTCQNQKSAIFHFIQSVHLELRSENGKTRSHEEQADHTERLCKGFPERIRYDTKQQQHDRAQGAGRLQQRRTGEESLSVL